MFTTIKVEPAFDRMKEVEPVGRPNIFQYHDYRVFLHDWMAFMKTDSPKFSLRKLAEEVGLSPAYLSLVLSQKRVLTAQTADQVASNLALEASERSYFKKLVQLSESRSQEQRLKAFQKIKRFQKYSKTNVKEVEAFNYLSKWYYVAIRELAAHADFKGDVRWIQKQLSKHVPATEIRKALNFLVEHGFLAKANGKFTIPNRDVDCLGGIFSLSLNQFHKDILKMASEAIDEVSKERRYLTGYTFLVSDESYKQLTDILEETKEKIRELEKSDSGRAGTKSVYHVELAAIPMTGRKK